MQKTLFFYKKNVWLPSTVFWLAVVECTVVINPSIIPKVGKAEAFYQQSNVSNPFKFTPDSNTIWGYDLGVEVSPRVMLVYQARTTYISDSENLGEFIPQKSVQIETQFTF